MRLISVAAHKIWQAYRAQVRAQEAFLRSQRPWEAEFLHWEDDELKGSFLPPKRFARSHH
jgi:hypothetical protein